MRRLLRLALCSVAKHPLSEIYWSSTDAGNELILWFCPCRHIVEIEEIGCDPLPSTST